MFFCVFSQGATSSPPAVSAADSSAVRELAHSLKARVGMAAEMLDTGETVMVGDEAAYPMQSVVKFVLALSVLKRVDQGAMNLEQIIRIRPEQLVKDTWSPLRERFPQGGDFSLKELLRVTVQESDNNTCDLLFGLIGGPQAVQKDLKEWGKNLKTEGEREMAGRASVDRAFSLLNGLLSAPRRDAERSSLMDLLAVLNDGEIADNGRVAFPQGTRKEWETVLSGFKAGARNEADMECFRKIKELVMPKDLEVIGIYRASQHTPSPDLFIPLVIGQELLGYEDDVVQAVALRVEDPYHVETMLVPVMQALEKEKPSSAWTLETWHDRFNAWFELMQKERMMMSFVLSFISLISAFCIMAVMFTVSIQRKKEIAVMKALGATPFQVVRVFLWQGVIIGFVGALLGVGLGLLVLEYRMQIQGFLAGIGFDPFPVSFHGTANIPVVIDWAELAWQAVKAFVMVVVASIIPALITARQDPARSLRSM